MSKSQLEWLSSILGNVESGSLKYNDKDISFGGRMDSLDDFKQASSNKEAVLFLMQDQHMAIYGAFTTVPIFFIAGIVSETPVSAIAKMPVNPKG